MGTPTVSGRTDKTAALATGSFPRASTTGDPSVISLGRSLGGVINPDLTTYPQGVYSASDIPPGGIRRLHELGLKRKGVQHELRGTRGDVAM